MHITLLRHGTRNFGIGDAPLNAIGLKEAEVLADNGEFAQTTHIIASPKKRAQMTVGPLALKLKIQLQSWPDLDQQRSDENHEHFARRVRQSLDKVEQSFGDSERILICSHSDWLTLAVDSMPSAGMDSEDIFFQCAEFRHFLLEDGLWKLT